MGNSPENRRSPAPKLGFAIASLIFGILAFLTSIIVVGAAFGFVGFLLGIVHLCRRQRSNGMAWGGMALSILGMVLGINLGLIYFRAANSFLTSVLEELAKDHVDPNQWVGVQAPEMEVTTLDGKKFTLSELKGKRVVIDFWATWCEPCVMEIPHFIELRKEISPDDLVIIGISEEDESVLKPFVTSKGINYPIASGKGLPRPFNGMAAIPTTFFIDRNGVIQNVVVGYHTLEKLKALATAADYAGEIKPEPKESPESGLIEAEEPLEFRLGWTLDVPQGTAICEGDWDSDGVPDILIAGSDKTLHIIGMDGKEKGNVTLPLDFERIELGRHKSSGARLLGYSIWGKEVTVVDAMGAVIWNYPSTSGVDGAHWGDLDGDGSDEMIVGMNGSEGLHAVSADGKMLWQVSDIGDVWNQAVIPTREGIPGRVFATEAGGKVQVIDATGNRTKVLNPLGQYFSTMAAARETDDGPVQIIVMEEVTLGLDEAGNVKWSTPATVDHKKWRRKTFASGDIDGDGTIEWAFVDGTDELVLVSPSGIKLGAVADQRMVDGFAIVGNLSQKGLLVTLRSGTVRGYRAE